MRVRPRVGSGVLDEIDELVTRQVRSCDRMTTMSMDTTKQKYWCRWYIPGKTSNEPEPEPETETETDIEWWKERPIGPHSVNCGLVHGDDPSECLAVIREGWPKASGLGFSKKVEPDWRPMTIDGAHCGNCSMLQRPVGSASKHCRLFFTPLTDEGGRPVRCQPCVDSEGAS